MHVHIDLSLYHISAQQLVKGELEEILQSWAISDFLSIFITKDYYKKSDIPGRHSSVFWLYRHWLQNCQCPQLRLPLRGEVFPMLKRTRRAIIWLFWFLSKGTRNLHGGRVKSANTRPPMSA